MINKIKRFLGSKIHNFVYWHFNYDRVAERKIKKSIDIWHRGKIFKRLRAEMMWYSLEKKYTTSYPPSITIGKNLRIEHCMGTRIGQTAVIGDNVRIYQYVNIIAKVVGDQDKLDKGERRHAKIGNNVILSAGCMIIGPVTIGDNCIIGARALVTHDVPPNSIVIGTNQIKPRTADQVAPKYATRK
ncbi:MAG: serine acetyltransferase [Oscillospiraceae bacterium]|nr:serine acetyltransferase [Oscillospiraceae bacterium]